MGKVHHRQIQKWTHEEIEILEKNFSLENIDKLIKFLPKRTEEGIVKKAKRLGLYGNFNDVWTDEEIKILIKNFQENSVYKIKNLLESKSIKHIQNKILELNLKRNWKNRKFWTKEEDEILAANYGKLSFKEIKQFLPHRTEISISARISNLNLKDDDVKKKFSISLGYRKYKVDDYYFSIPNLENCYWAGFLAADGNILNGKKIQVDLSIKDRIILENFKNSLDSNMPIKTRIIKSGYKIGNESCYFRFTSLQIAEDLLKNFNIGERKTFNLKPPNIKDENLIMAFVIGFIDGDGSVSIRRKSIEITSGSTEILEWIKFYFDKWQSSSRGRNNGIEKYKNRKNAFRYRISGRRMMTIYKILKNINVPKLKRKWGEEGDCF